jgi:PGF-pre-PGF domain-containing protein
MNKSTSLLMAILVFTLSSGIGTAEIIVQPGGSIQAAVNNATSSGDLIIVKPGVYYENIVINKPNLMIESESRDPENTVIMAKNANANVFYTGVNGTTISGFKIKSGGYSGVTGIHLTRCSNCNISNNNLSYNDIGISLSDSNSNAISDNRINSNIHDGIYLLRSDRNTILNNIVYFNNHGIVLENASSNSLTSNQVVSNTGLGFYLRNSSSNNLDINIATRNDRGIYLLYSNTNIMSSNSISENNNYGILISHSNYNTISRNTANRTSRGIHLDSSTSNIVSGNTVAANSVSGFFMCRACHKNLFYNNYANNTLNADINITDTNWNLTKTAGRNIVGGPYIGGNFWANPTGDGFSETAQDKDGDGIADTPYTWLNANRTNVTDYLPLVHVSNSQLPVLPVANFNTNSISGAAPLAVQFTDLSQNSLSRSWDIDNDGIPDYNQKSFTHLYEVPGNYTVTLTAINEYGTSSKTQQIIVEASGKNQTLPVANFSSNLTSGYAPLSVQFTDLSQNAASRSWDFNNDEANDSSEISPVYTYTVPGTYTVSLTAINANGSTSKTAKITVLEGSSSDGGSSSGESSEGSSHSSGGSSGGGAGGSPEPQSNVEIKEISQTFISSGTSAKFDFPQKVTPIVYVSFDSKKTAGKTTTIAELLKGKSTLVSELPADEVYKFLNIWVGNSGFATSKNIENSVLSFKVAKSWVQDKKIDKSSITLNRYSDKTWNQLPTSLSSEDDNYLYFTAQSPGFSPFAITGKIAAETKTQPAVLNETQPEPKTENIEKNNESTASNTGQQQEQNRNTSTSGFEILYSIIGLLAVFLHKRKMRN